MTGGIGIDLSLVWAGIISFGVIMYVLLDGFDLGIGILFLFVRERTGRDVLMNSIAPVWDGNETWLVLGGVTLFGAFPLAYGTLLPALYLPLTGMLIALVLRGASFEFRARADATSGHTAWDIAFAGGSAFAAFCQGTVVGAFVQGFDLAPASDGGVTYAGGALDSLTAFSAMTGIALLFGYALLGACWLILKTEGELQEWAREIAGRLLWAVLGFIVLVSAVTPLLNPSVAERWFSLPNFFYFFPVPAVTALLAWGAWHSLQQRRPLAPFLFSTGLFLLSFCGLGVSLFPFIIPPSVTIWEAAAAPDSQTFLLVGVAVMIPIILVYTGYAYRVFRGKVKPDKAGH